MWQPLSNSLLGKGLVVEESLLSADKGKLKRATQEGNHQVKCLWYK